MIPKFGNPASRGLFYAVSVKVVELSGANVGSEVAAPIGHYIDVFRSKGDLSILMEVLTPVGIHA